ncbi:hypothetical protein, partial [Streptomyces sp. SID13726]|uniref:hypothetical protein n=1 Tax=Streptomyces sp. SID13726 TaxID=2706058 RepID=UPI001943540D
EVRAQADQAHARFTDPHSDFLTYLNVWEYVREQQHELSSSAFRRLCKAEYLNFLRIREWQDVVAQLREMSKPLGIDMSYKPRAGRSGSGPAAEGASGSPAADPATAPDAAAAEQSAAYKRAWDGDTIH